MLNQASLETEQHPIETLIRKLWPAPRKAEAKKVRLWDRRQNYRLKLREVGTVQVAVKPETGPAFKSVLFDLSAGGFSCTSPIPAHLKANTTVTIRMRLPDDEPLLLETEAVFLEENSAKNAGGIGRFRFTDALTIKHQDRIHEFILKAQFQKLKKAKPVPA